MKVILQKDIYGVGDAGEIRDVADGYARNFLLPQKLVVPAHAGSRKALHHHKRLMSLKTEKRKKEMEGVSKQLEQIGELELPVRVGAKGKLFGSVTSIMIARALDEKGFPIDKRKIEIADQIKSLGTVKVKVKLSEDITVPLTLNIIAHPDSIAEQQEAEETQAQIDRAEAASEQARKEAEQAEEASAEPEASGESEAAAEETKED